MAVQIFNDSGAAVTVNEDELIRRCAELESSAVHPFSPEVLDCLKLLSRRLLTSEFARSMPQIMALGYWIRPSALSALQGSLRSADDDSEIVAPRGVAFHLPPQNVDTLFAYSWVLSYLVGNCNIVRMSRSPTELSLWLIEQIMIVLGESKQIHRNIFCTYDYDTGCTARISIQSDLRVIWGGDEKIGEVSKSVTRPDGLTLGFSDRKSMCLINTSAWQRLSADEKKSVAQDLFNDIFWFDQLGCGSPRLIAWIGSETPDPQELYEFIDQIAQEKNQEIPTGIDLQKFTFANAQLANGGATTAQRISSNLTIIESGSDSSIFDQVMGGGLLFQVRLNTLLDVVDLLRADTQTITEFGFQRSEKLEFAKAMSLKGGYRLVPVGRALEFNSVWDGVDLLKHFTRTVTIY